MISTTVLFIWEIVPPTPPFPGDPSNSSFFKSLMELMIAVVLNELTGD